MCSYNVLCVGERFARSTRRRNSISSGTRAINGAELGDAGAEDESCVVVYRARLPKRPRVTVQWRRNDTTCKQRRVAVPNRKALPFGPISRPNRLKCAHFQTSEREITFLLPFCFTFGRKNRVKGNENVFDVIRRRKAPPLDSPLHRNYTV